MPVWEQAMLRTAAFDLCSAAFRFFATVAFSDELLREANIPAVLPNLMKGLITRCRMYASQPRTLDREVVSSYKRH
jgi:hypothetical protein